MAAKTITLRSDLVERFERLARAQGRTLDDVFNDLLEQYTSAGENWALALAEAMEEADINWHDEADLSAYSRKNFEQHTYEKWQRTQDADQDD